MALNYWKLSNYISFKLVPGARIPNLKKIYLRMKNNGMLFHLNPYEITDFYEMLSGDKFGSKKNSDHVRKLKDKALESIILWTEYNNTFYPGEIDDIQIPEFDENAYKALSEYMMNTPDEWNIDTYK